MIKLKRCPFCGGEAEIERDVGRKGWVVSIVCWNCDLAMGGGIYYDSLDEAIESVVKVWNKRHEPPTPHGAIVPAGNYRLKKVVV